MRNVWVLLAAATLIDGAAAAEVRAWQGTMPLPASVEGAPDPNPPFDLFASTRFNYPYTLRENITGQQANVAWRALFLENEYLKCSVLPDLGGHLYTCVDKISGQPMFYANPSIKKARIGYRGAWAAFGIEFNFPVSHNWVSMSPVDFSTKKNADGSASIFVSNIDRPYGMQWTVELRLAPASTLLEQRVTLYNRSDVRRRFYWWSNAAVRAWDDSKIWYPMRWTASHGFTEVNTWPVDSAGTDLSVIRNQTKGPVSLFVHGSREPFMGVYHPHTQTGVAHYADYGSLPGKKIWSWGVDADGLDWRRALSDDNSAYLEVQAGLMRDQETYAFLEPRKSVGFTEYWMPARGIGGIVRAGPAGVLNLSRKSGKLIAAFNANTTISNAQIRIVDGARMLYETRATLSPEKTWIHEIAAESSVPLTFELRDTAAQILLRQTEGEYDWSPESAVRAGPQPRPPVSDPLTIGTSQELNGDLLRAYETYTRALDRTPDNLPLLVAAGRLAASLLRYSDALRWLVPAQERANSDPDIAYYLGIAYQGLGRIREARTQFETAQRMPAFRAAGRLKLAELVSREGDLRLASEYLDTIDPDDLRAQEERIAIHRALKRSPSDPAPALSLFLSENTGGDPERVLLIAGEYMRLGLWRAALGVLLRERKQAPPDQREPGIPAAANHPLIAYYRAFCREKLKEPASADYEAASKLPTAYVFPSGAETLEVLEAAVRSRPGDAAAHFLLGSLRMASGLVDDAVTEWTTTRRLNPNIPVLDANLGRTLLRAKRDPRAALEAFRAGLRTDSHNTEIYAGLQVAMGILGRPAAESVAALEAYPDLSHMPASLVYELALDYAEARRFDKATGLLHNRFFPREEGGTNVRHVWIRVRAMEARSKADGGQCDAALRISGQLGQPVDGLAFTLDGLDGFIAASQTQADIGYIESRCGRAESARRRLDRLVGAADPAAIAFAFELARVMDSFQPQEWTARLEAARNRAEAHAAAGGSSSSWWNAIAGILAANLGKTDAACARLESALLGPDRDLAHHLSRQWMRRLRPANHPAQ